MVSAFPIIVPRAKTSENRTTKPKQGMQSLFLMQSCSYPIQNKVKLIERILLERMEPQVKKTKKERKLTYRRVTKVILSPTKLIGHNFGWAKLLQIEVPVLSL